MNKKGTYLVITPFFPSNQSFVGSYIYDQAVRVYESFSVVLESFKKLTDKLEEAKNRLQDGRGSLLGRVEKLKEMGRLSTKKQLPEETIDKDET